MSSSSSGYYLLDRHIQRWIMRQRWPQLRPIQEQAIVPIQEGRHDVLISAATASGKTEAAFMPALSAILDEEKRCAGVPPVLIYIAPLKALINDQYNRLDTMLAGTDIAITAWHGDTSNSAKKRFLTSPSGVLLITPESLEGLFVRPSCSIEHVFKGACHVIIDEWHAFIGTERGKQLQSLLARLDIAIRRQVPRIGLSATLGDLSIACDELRPGNGDKVITLEDKSAHQDIRMQLRGYEAAPKKRTPMDKACLDIAAEDEIAGNMLSIGDHLFSTLRGHSNLVFANSKRLVEILGDMLHRKTEQQQLPEEFFVHHGSLSKELREYVEKTLKDSQRPMTVICTSTLEMGVDIGSVHSVAQIGEPHEVASLRQRLGRSGRRGESAILRLYVLEKEFNPGISYADALRLHLFQAVAMIELLLAGWCEPPIAGALHLSTLQQQIMSVIAQHGGATARDIWRVLVEHGAFGNITQSQFVTLLKAMGQQQLIQQEKDGLLIPGEEGEYLVNSYEFYAVFATPQEYTLFTQGKQLGKVSPSTPLKAGDMFIFAGRRWRIKDVDQERKSVLLEPSRGGMPPSFNLSTGGELRDEVRQRMYALYKDDYIPAYLNHGALRLFKQGRDFFAESQLNESRVIFDACDIYLFLWIGDRIIYTITSLLSLNKMQVSIENGLVVINDAGLDQLVAVLESILASSTLTAEVLAASVPRENRSLEKYDHYLPDSLSCSEFAARRFDLPGAKNILRQLLEVLSNKKAASAESILPSTPFLR